MSTNPNHDLAMAICKFANEKVRGMERGDGILAKICPHCGEGYLRALYDIILFVDAYEKRAAIEKYGEEAVKLMELIVEDRINANKSNE